MGLGFSHPCFKDGLLLTLSGTMHLLSRHQVQCWLRARVGPPQVTPDTCQSRTQAGAMAQGHQQVKRMGQEKQVQEI